MTKPLLHAILLSSLVLLAGCAGTAPPKGDAAKVAANDAAYRNKNCGATGTRLDKSCGGAKVAGTGPVGLQGNGTVDSKENP